MAALLQASGGVIGTLVPTTTWGAPNGLFPTVDRNDGAAYSWNSATSTATLPASGLATGYLFVWGFETEDSSNGRYNPQGRMVQASGTGTFASASTGGYSRDASEDRAYVSGWSFVHNPSASATFTFEWRRDSDAPNTTDGTVRSYLQVIPLYYADVGIYTSTSTTATGGTTPVQIGGFSGTDGTNITLSSNVVSVTGDNKRYLALGGAYHQGIGNARTQRWYGFRIDGSKDDAAKGCMYYRNVSNADGGESFVRLLETATATRTLDLFQYRGDGVAAGQGGANVDGNVTGSNSSHAMVVIELNDSAEVFSSTDSVGGQEFALTGPVDVDVASTGDIEFSDAASFTRASDTAVNAEVAMDVLAFSNVSHAREASSIGSGSRWTVHGEFTINGAEQTGVGFHGNYNRGNQSTQDCHGSSSNQLAAFALAADDDIGVSNQELAGTEGGAGDIETQAGWVGFGLINLDTLEDAGAASVTPNESSQAQASDQASITENAQLTPNDSSQAQASDAASISENAQLAPSESSQAQASDQVVLTENAQLTPNDSSQAQASGSPAATPVVETTAPTQMVLDNPRGSGDAIVLDNPLGAGDAALTPTDTAQAQASDQASITESAQLTANDSSQAQASDAASISENAQLAPTESSQAQASDQASLTENAQLTANESSQAQSSDTAAITEHAALTPTDTAQAQASDQASITESAQLTANDSSQAQASDATSISENAQLAPTESSQAQSSDQTSVTAAGSVTPNDSSQAQASDAASITEQASLAPSESSQAQASDQVVLSENAQLTANESSQAQASDAASISENAQLAPTESSQAQASDQASITEHAALTPDESSQAQSSDQTSVTSADSVTPLDSSQAQSSDTAAITEHADVDAGAGSTQAQTSDQATISVAGSVAPLDSSQAQASDQVVLSENAQLTANESSQAQSSEAAAISENAALTPIESSQAQASDQVAITEHADVDAGAGSTQAQTSDQAVISVAGQLVPLDSSQAQSSDTAGLTEQAQLAPTETNQAQTSDAAALVPTDNVTPNDTAQAQSSDSVSVLQRPNVTPESSAQAQASGTVAVRPLSKFLIEELMRDRIRNRLQTQFVDGGYSEKIYTGRVFDPGNLNQFLEVTIAEGDVINGSDLSAVTQARLQIGVHMKRPATDDDLDEVGDSVEASLLTDRQLGGLVHGTLATGFRYETAFEQQYAVLYLFYDVVYEVIYQ